MAASHAAAVRPFQTWEPRPDRPSDTSLKPIGYILSYLACRIEHLASIWQPHIINLIPVVSWQRGSAEREARRVEFGVSSCSTKRDKKSDLLHANQEDTLGK
jgi:hypothetical protein